MQVPSGNMIIGNFSSSSTCSRSRCVTFLRSAASLLSNQMWLSDLDNVFWRKPRVYRMIGVLNERKYPRIPVAVAQSENSNCHNSELSHRWEKCDSLHRFHSSSHDSPDREIEFDSRMTCCRFEMQLAYNACWGSFESWRLRLKLIIIHLPTLD